MLFINDQKKNILCAAFIAAFAAAGCATPQVRPLAAPPEPATVAVRVEQEPADQKPTEKVEAPVPAVDVKKDEPAPAADVKVAEPAPAPDSNKEETVSATAAKVEEPTTATAAKVEEPAPAPVAKKEEPVPALVNVEEPALAAAVKNEEPALAHESKKEETISSPHATVHAIAPSRPSEETIRHHASVPEPRVKAEKEPAQSARASEPPAPSSAAKQQKAFHARGKNQEERASEVVPMPTGHSHRTLAERNDERLLYVFTGMYKSTVDQIMGGRYYYKREYWLDPDNHVIEVLFYLTREPKKGTAVTERHLTPVLIKDSRVSALGKYKLKKLRRVAKRISSPTTAAK